MQVNEFKWNALSDYSLFVLTCLDSFNTMYPWSKPQLLLMFSTHNVGGRFIGGRSGFIPSVNSGYLRKQHYVIDSEMWHSPISLGARPPYISCFSSLWHSDKYHFLLLSQCCPSPCFQRWLWSIRLFQCFGDFGRFYIAKALQMSYNAKETFEKYTDSNSTEDENILTITVLKMNYLVTFAHILWQVNVTPALSLAEPGMTNRECSGPMLILWTRLSGKGYLKRYLNIY